MSVAALTITVTGPPAEETGSPVSRRCVRVKQDNSQRTQCPGGGADLIKMIKRLMGLQVASSDEEQPFDGVFRVPIITQDNGQGYSISITHGTLGDPKEELTRHNETIFASPADWAAAGEEVELELTDKLEFVPDAVLLARIVGQALDSSGNPLLSATVRISGSKLITGTACNAQIAVSYDAYTTTQQVEIPPRGSEEEAENYYQSSLVIQSECGGLERINIEVPQCFEDFRVAWKDLLDEWKNLLDEWNKLLDGEDGGLTINQDEEEPEGADLDLKWDGCDLSLQGDSLGIFKHLEEQGDVCYPGVLCLDIECQEPDEEDN